MRVPWSNLTWETWMIKKLCTSLLLTTLLVWAVSILDTTWMTMNQNLNLKSNKSKSIVLRARLDPRLCTFYRFCVYTSIVIAPSSFEKRADVVVLTVFDWVLTLIHLWTSSSIPTPISYHNWSNRPRFFFWTGGRQDFFLRHLFTHTYFYAVSVYCIATNGFKIWFKNRCRWEQALYLCFYYSMYYVW